MTLGPSFPPPASSSRSQWVGRAGILDWAGNSVPQWARYLVLSISFLGLQLVWSCEMAQASPYLLSLGVSKSMMSVVFLAGPLSGLIVQPVVGVLSDSCKSSLGRRRPFIIAGCILSSVAVLLLGFSTNLAAILFEDGGVAHNRLTIVFAVIAVYVIDFSINVVQAMDRSLLVDVIPPNLQPAANAWASRVSGFGSVFAFWVGGLDLVDMTGGWLGGTQLKVVAVFTSVFLCVCHAVTVGCVRERVLVSRGDENVRSEGALRSMLTSLGEIWVTLRTLPRPIQQVLNVQFSSWIGWFPVLFFSTSWIAELYATTHFGSPDLSLATPDGRDAATRAGTRAMLFHALISFSTSVILPPFIATDDPTEPPRATGGMDAGWGHVRDRAWWHALVPELPLPWLSLSLLWTFSNGLFGVLMLSTWFAGGVGSATAIIAGAGFCWSITNWAPFAILGDLILTGGGAGEKRSQGIALGERARGQRVARGNSARLSQGDGEMEGEELADLLAKPQPQPQPGAGAGLGDGWQPSAAGGSEKGDDISRPTTPDTAFFDASAETPGRTPGHGRTRHESGPGSPSGSSTGGSRSDGSPSVGRPQARVRQDSHPYSGRGRLEFPANNSQTAFQDPYASAQSLSDPYSYLPGEHDHAGASQVLQIRHSDSFDYGEAERLGYIGASAEGEYGLGGGIVPAIRVGGVEGEEWDGEVDEEGEGDGEGDGGADQAGVILGCHNIYLVLPQFLVTALSSIIFAFLAPHHSVLSAHPAPATPAAVNVTSAAPAGLSGEAVLEIVTDLARRAAEAAVGDASAARGWDALGMIFRIGGVSALVSAWICWKMTRERDGAARAQRRVGR